MHAAGLACEMRLGKFLVSPCPLSLFVCLSFSYTLPPSTPAHKGKKINNKRDIRARETRKDLTTSGEEEDDDDDGWPTRRSSPTAPLLVCSTKKKKTLTHIRFSRSDSIHPSSITSPRRAPSFLTSAHFFFVRLCTKQTQHQLTNKDTNSRKRQEIRAWSGDQ